MRRFIITESITCNLQNGPPNQMAGIAFFLLYPFSVALVAILNYFAFGAVAMVMPGFLF